MLYSDLLEAKAVDVSQLREAFKIQKVRRHSMLETLKEIVKVCSKLEKMGFHINLLINDGYISIEIPVEKDPYYEKTIQAITQQDTPPVQPDSGSYT